MLIEKKRIKKPKKFEKVIGELGCVLEPTTQRGTVNVSLLPQYHGNIDVDSVEREAIAQGVKAGALLP